MIKIDLLKNHTEAIPAIAKIWQETIGKIWLPDVSIGEIEQGYYGEIQSDNLPISWIALDNDTPIGTCSLSKKDGIRSDLTPWLADLCIDKNYQNQGIGTKLIDITKEKAKALELNKLYLFAFDLSIPEWYIKLGWQKIGIDEFKGHPVTVMEMVL
jgi:GNAT superfamily N-acetyltransferase